MQKETACKHQPPESESSTLIKVEFMARSLTRHKECVLVMYCLSAWKVALILFTGTESCRSHFFSSSWLEDSASRGPWRKTARLGGQEVTFPSGVRCGPVASGCVCKGPSSTELWGGGLMLNGGVRWQVSLSIQLRCSPSSSASEYHRSHDFQGQPGVNFSFAVPPLRFRFLLHSLSVPIGVICLQHVLCL